MTGQLADAAFRDYLVAREIPEPCIREILACFRRKPIAKGARFALAGEPGTRIGFLLDGVFSMEVTNPDGNLFVKEFVLPCSLLLASPVPGGENRVSLRAVTPAKILEAEFGAVLSVTARHPGVPEIMRRGAEARLEAIATRLESFALCDATERYRVFLRDHEQYEAVIPQYLVASWLGITPTQLSRIRKTEK